MFAGGGRGGAMEATSAQGVNVVNRVSSGLFCKEKFQRAVETTDLMKKGLRRPSSRFTASTKVETTDLMKKGLKELSNHALGEIALPDPLGDEEVIRRIRGEGAAPTGDSFRRSRSRRSVGRTLGAEGFGYVLRPSCSGT